MLLLEIRIFSVYQGQIYTLFTNRGGTDQSTENGKN